MKKTGFFILTFIFVCASIAVSEPSLSPRASGSELFNKHCAACHPNAALIKPEADIVAIMRNPVPPMPTFKSDKVSDDDAQSIAAFIRVRIYCARIGKKST